MNLIAVIFMWSIFVFVVMLRASVVGDFDFSRVFLRRSVLTHILLFVGLINTIGSTVAHKLVVDTFTVLTSPLVVLAALFVFIDFIFKDSGG
jgi:hypothetical protein